MWDTQNGKVDIKNPCSSEKRKILRIKSPYRILGVCLETNSNCLKENLE
jgi:hypothetical protein